MLAREDEEQAQEIMLEQFEQSLEHLDKAGITSIEVLQSVIEDGIAQFHLLRNLHLKVIVRVRGCVGVRRAAWWCASERN